MYASIKQGNKPEKDMVPHRKVREKQVQDSSWAAFLKTSEGRRKRQGANSQGDPAELTMLTDKHVRRMLAHFGGN